MDEEGPQTTGYEPICRASFSAVVGRLWHGRALAATDEEEVRKTVGGFEETWNRHDVDALSALFSPDANIVIITSQVWRGRQGIHEHLVASHGTIPEDRVKEMVPPQRYGVFKTVTYRFDNVEIQFIHKDVAVALVGWTQLGDPRFQDKPRQGTFTFVVGRKGDMWMIDAAHNTQRP